MVPSLSTALPLPPTRTSGACPLVLLVEDDPAMNRFLQSVIVDHGLRVVTASDGHEALVQASSHNPEIVLLDLGLPDMDGLEVTTRLRRWSTAPILVVSAREQQADKVTALDAGANDFITKPFGVGELLARVRVWLRHAARAPESGAKASKQVGDIRIDWERRLVFVGEREVHLTRTEYKLLALLLENVGKVLTHRQILERVWGPGHGDDAHYVRIYMGQLRRKIERDVAQPRYLVTESGIGYRLRAEPAETTP